MGQNFIALLTLHEELIPQPVPATPMQIYHLTDKVDVWGLEFAFLATGSQRTPSIAAPDEQRQVWIYTKSRSGFPVTEHLRELNSAC